MDLPQALPGPGLGVLFAALRAGGQRLAVPKGQWARLWLLAFFNITGWNMLVAFGLTLIPSGRAAILAYTMPVWAIPLSVWLLGERPTARKWPASRSASPGSRCFSARASPASARRRSARCWCSARRVLGDRHGAAEALPGGDADRAYTAWIMLLGGVPIFVGALLLDDLARARARWLFGRRSESPTTCSSPSPSRTGPGSRSPPRCR